jgi:predicted polyphosphate/ATP-dependent NAD kinase
VSPEAAGELLVLLARGGLVGMQAREVRDIDEEAFRDGVVRARFYGEQARKAAERATWRSETRELVWSYRRAIKAHRSANLVRMIRYA